MAYIKKDNYPSLRKPGVYPDGSTKELGLDNDNLEKFSLGNWNSISKSNRKFFIGMAQPDVDSFIAEQIFENNEYLGRPVYSELHADGVYGPPILVSTVRKNYFRGINDLSTSDFDELDGDYSDYDGLEDESDVGYVDYDVGSNWTDFDGEIIDGHQFGPVHSISRLVKDDFDSMGLLQDIEDYQSIFGYGRNQDWSCKASDMPPRHRFDGTNPNVELGESTFYDYMGPYDEDNSTWDAGRVRVQKFIYTRLMEKYQELKDLLQIENNYAFIQPGESIDTETWHNNPIRIKYRTAVQSQINDILNFYIEMGFGPTNTGPVSDRTGGDMHRRYQLWFGGGLNQFVGLDTLGDPWPEDFNPENSDVLTQESDYDLQSIIRISDVVSGEFNVNKKIDFLLNKGNVGTEEQPIYELNFEREGSQSEENEDRLYWLGHPSYILDYSNEYLFASEDQVELDEVDYEVRCNPSGLNIELIYYDDIENFIQTSYPLKVELNVGLHYYPNFVNITTVGNIIQQVSDFFSPEASGISFSPDENYYKYKVIQWGDEKLLLTDDQILNSEVFYLYSRHELPEPGDFYLKRIAINNAFKLDINQSSFHVYNQPGVKSIKIIVYRYESTGDVVLQTTLVTKNIVVNDGILLSQDFSIFGGTDFNFLPLKTKDIEGEERPLQAIIGGLDEDSKYNNSVEKIVKDDNFIQDDYLERASSKDFIDNFNKGLYGELPGQLDLGINRIFKGSYDIYDFITDNKSKIVQDGFEITELPINSFATDIFIDDDNCIVELVPQELEYLTIPNEVGTNAKAILIGDYKVNQPKDGAIQREGVMQTPVLENNQDKQAF